MPLGGELSLDMMYRTCGTQLNVDYNSEEDFIKKFKVVNSIAPISIALFANSSIVEKKNSHYLSYRSKVWQNTSRGGLPKIFFENLNFEKYADFIINFPILFINNKEKFISGKNYIFQDFMEGKIDEIKTALLSICAKDVAEEFGKKTRVNNAAIEMSNLFLSNLFGKDHPILNSNANVNEEEDEDEYELTDADEEDWEEEDEEEEDLEEEEEEDEDESLAAAKSAALEKIRERLSKRNENAPLPPQVQYDGKWKFPQLDLLEESEPVDEADRSLTISDQAEQLLEAFSEFGIDGEIQDIDAGPTITLFAVKLARGTKVGSIRGLTEDLARAMEVPSLRIDSNIGQGRIGIEVPNPAPELVRIREILESGKGAKMGLPMYLGKNASGESMVYDLTKMPHMLIAGTTGSGKSVCINTILMSWLFTKRPDEVKLVLVDPKQVEFDTYKAIPHLACPVVTKTDKAKGVLQWAVHQMESRYTLLKNAKVRNIGEYNKLGEDPEKLCKKMGITDEREMKLTPKKLPFIVIVVDELADLILEEGKDAELPIVRIAQKARAVGIHLILATQRPERNVVTGLIKSNVPFRVACRVNSSLDSRIMLDVSGAEVLLGNGDMLIKDGPKLVRGQGAFVSTEEIVHTAGFLEDVAAPQFERDLVRLDEIAESDEADPYDVLKEALEDQEFDKAVRLLIERDSGSITLLKTRLRMGDTRASRMVEQMRQAGIVGEAKGAGVASDILIDLAGWEDMKKLMQAKDRSSMLAEYHDEGEEDLDGEDWESEEEE